MELHALVWWETHLTNCEKKKRPIVKSWQEFNELLRDKFYHIFHKTDQMIKWKNFRQGSFQRV